VTWRQSVGLFDLHQSFVEGPLDRPTDGSIIERRAKRHAVRVFLDEVDLLGGDRIPSTIKANLRACDEFVILLSQEALLGSG
jgi:hypothetical protein